ncbi:MAG TPA: amino acid adenylation domain-containing protein, partial [Blastocatellia bacterium]|nr:amino acid adenylation domain-containing protein [Blastocatellia bacterium]
MSIDQTERLEKLSPVEKALLLKFSREKTARLGKFKSIHRRERREEYPLSFAQQRLWFFDQLIPDSPLYNIPFALRLSGDLSVEGLRWTLTEIVRRHEVLRTTFELRRDQPVQVIASASEVALPVIELSGLETREREDQVRLLTREEVQRPFDLKRGPLWRASLLRLGEREHIALFTMHHAVSDDWSTRVLVNEVAALYEAYLKGEGSPLPEPEIQYVDYAEWQRERLAGGGLEGEFEYWKKRLRDVAVLPLPTDRRRPATPSYRGGLERVELGRELSEKLRMLGQREGATPFMVLMAVFKVLLMRYSGEEDVIVGTSIANRVQREVEGLIGFFVNTLALRTDLSGNPSFRELIGREREVALGAYEHQEIPFEKLVEEINPERVLSLSPLFQVLLTLQNTRLEELEIKGLKISAVEDETIAAKFDLALNLTEGIDGIAGNLEYSLDLYEGETIGRMARHFERLVLEVVRDAGQRINGIELIGETEKRQLLEEWNQTEQRFGRPRLVLEMIAQQWAASSERIAVVGELEQVSYGELDRRANLLGNYLRGLGVGPEVIVGLYLGRSVEMIVAVMGVLKAGGAYLPLDTESPLERLSVMLEDAGVGVVLTERRLEERLPAFWGEPICLDKEWERICEEGARAPVYGPARGIEAENLAYVIYTSGSTGKPKGVMAEHKGLCNLVEAQKEAFRLGERSRVLQFASLSFDASVSEIFCTLAAGGSLHVYGRESLMPGADLVRVLREDQITAVTLPPTVLAAISDDGLTNLETVIAAGEACGEAIVDRWARGRRFIDAYGPTEATVCASLGECEAGSNRKPGIGRPIANTRLYVLDYELQPVPVGVRGELYLAGVGVSRGYLGRPDLTAERFIPNPFSREEGDRLYRTGDVVRSLADRSLEFVGRADEQFKIRGYRIESGEIEAVLNGHGSVKQSVVVAKEDERGDRRLLGYVVAEEGVTAAELKIHVRERLPEYMVPSAIVMLENLPLTPSGKVDRRALPEPDGAQIAREYEAPIGVTETALARIWAEVLKLEQVGRNDNFFELGGHSLLAVRLVERMRREGLDADVRTLFATPTLSALAGAVGARSDQVDIPPNRVPPGCEMITPEMLPLVQLSPAEIERIVGMVPGGAANVQDIYPLAPLQEGILFHHLLGTEGDVYLTPTLLSFDTRERLDGFLQALPSVIDRHDILRTAVLWEELAEPVQVVWRQASLIVEEVSLGPNAGDVAEQLQSRFDPKRYRLDIRQAPLMRAYLACDARHDRWVMLLLLHHLSVDHTGLEVLLEEIQARLQGRTAQLPAPMPFRNFVARARLGVSREEHENFFRGMLGDVEEPTAPFGLIDVRGDGSGIRESGREVDARLGIRLRQKARSLGVSAASLFHLAWAQVLARVSGRDDVVFGTSLFGRMEGGEGADRVVGMLINTLPCRIRVGEESVEEGVRQTHTLLTQLLRHEHAPLALAQRCSGVEAPAPLFSALLNYRHNTTGDRAAGESLSAWEGIESLGGEERTGYPFNLIVDDWGERFDLTAQVESPVEPGRICDYMHTALERLAEALEEAPATPLWNLEVLPAAEQDQLLVKWNETGRPYPHDRCIHEIFAEQAARAPERIAMIEGGHRVTYAELDRRANQLGNYLRRLGVGREVVVGLCMERSVEIVVALMGVLKAGGAYLPLNPESPLERLSFMLEDAEVGVVLTERRLADRLPTFWGQTVCLDEEWERIGEECESGPENRNGAGNLAYIIYTSGSTGLPKGVVVEHHGVVNLAQWQAHTFRLTPESCISQFFSYSFDGAVGETFMALLNGATLVISAPGDLEPGRLMEFLNRHRINVGVFVPSVLKQLDPDLIEHREQLTIVSVGENCPVELAATWARRCRFINAYGPTEYTVYSHLRELKERELKDLSCVPIGHPMDNTGSYILDRRLRPVPAGVSGEIYLTGAGIARGYLNQPQLTGAKFIPSHFFNDDAQVDYGVIAVGGALEEIDRFKDRAGLAEHDRPGKPPAAPEYISSRHIMESVRSLDSDLIESTALFIDRYCEDEFAYRGFSRYFQEGAQASYASCGINKDLLKRLLPFRSFAGLKGIDFGFGNAEVLEALSEMEAHMLGLDLSPFLVQRARGKNLNVRMAKVDVSPERFAEECDVEEESQDFAISTLTLDRLENPGNFLVNLFKSLKEGGCFAIQTILPIVPVDDGQVERPITYTSTHNRITPGQSVEQDKRSLVAMLRLLGANDVKICRLPYVVASRDGVQE